MFHSLVHKIALDTCKKSVTSKKFLNISIGMIPLGQVLCIAWYNHLDNKNPNLIKNFISTLLIYQELNNLHDVLNKIQTSAGLEPVFNPNSIPKSRLFLPGEKLRIELARKNQEINIAAISRCIILILT